MKKKLFNIVRTTLTDTTGQDIQHETKTDRDSQLKMANAKKVWLLEYQQEREKKREYIKEHVLAQGLDESKLLEKMQSTKSTLIPSIDEFTLVELTNLVEELHLEVNKKKDEGQGPNQEKEEGFIDSSSKPVADNSDAKSSMALFDKLQEKEDQELDDSCSSVKSSNSFRSVSTRKAKLTILNQKACAQIYVQDVFQLITSKIGKYVRAQSLMVVMHTYPMGWKVQRLDIDFVQLRNYLIKKYPQVIIPPLPIVNQKKKLNKKQLYKKKIYYQKFMHIVLKSKVLRGCKFLVDFLKEQDQYKFGYDLSVKEQTRGPRRVKQIKTLTGEVLCEASDMAKLFCNEFNHFNNEYQRINNQISKKCKNIETYSKLLASQYFMLSTELDNLQKLVLAKTEIPQFSNLYQRMSELVRKTGDLAIHQGFMVNDQLNAQFKYQREQGRTSFVEAYLLVQGSERKYERAKVLIEQEKYKLFKKQDYEQWEIQDPAIMKEVYRVRQNYDEVKQFMLPAKTQAVQELMDESQYFKQQLFNEVRRTIMLDYLSSRENFLEVGEQYSKHMQKNIKDWHQFILFYSDINNARKQKDEEYKKEQYVGEELDWKMLADNLTLFGSQIDDLKDIKGFDDQIDDQNMLMNQSIVVQNSARASYGAKHEEPFQADNISMVGGSYRSNSNTYYSSQQNQNYNNYSKHQNNAQYRDDFRPHPSQQQNNFQQQNDFGNRNNQGYGNMAQAHQNQYQNPNYFENQLQNQASQQQRYSMGKLPSQQAQQEQFIKPQTNIQQQPINQNMDNFRGQYSGKPLPSQQFQNQNYNYSGNNIQKENDYNQYDQNYNQQHYQQNTNFQNQQINHQNMEPHNERFQVEEQQPVVQQSIQEQQEYYREEQNNFNQEEQIIQENQVVEADQVPIIQQQEIQDSQQQDQTQNENEAKEETPLEEERTEN